MEKRKAGRPPLQYKRSKVLQIRFTERDFEILEDLAKKAGMNTAAFVRGNILSDILEKYRE